MSKLWGINNEYVGEYWSSQIAKTFGLTSIRYRPNAKVSDQYLIDIDPRVFTIWDVTMEPLHCSLIHFRSMSYLLTYTYFIHRT